MEGEGLVWGDLRHAVHKLTGIRVHVVGDTIVDSYTQCSMIGSMGKTPTMSVRFDEKQDFTGGAAVVAKHVRAAGAGVDFSTRLSGDGVSDQGPADLARSRILAHALAEPARPAAS